MASDNVIRAFSEDHVVRLTSLTKNQLRYWDKTEFFNPSFSKQGGAYGRVYSFRDVTGLKTIALLRQKYNISLQHLRRVASKLSKLSDDVWSTLKLYVLNGEVHFKEPDSGKVMGALSEQYAVIPLVEIINDIVSEAEKLKIRPKERIGQIERNRYVARNAWVVAGTRIPTRLIKDFHDAGYSIAKIKKEYPLLTTKDIKAALKFEEETSKVA